MLNPEEIVAVAKDVIKQIKFKRYYVRVGRYIEFASYPIEDLADSKKDLQDIFREVLEGGEGNVAYAQGAL